MAERVILIAEDETLVAMDIERIVRASGYAVAAVVDTGASAIAEAERTRPDLILMDVRLKGELDGIEAARRIRASRDVPVVFLTAYADPATVARAREVTPHGYLSKPFEERELQRMIDLALARSESERSGRERAARALWESEERYRVLLDAVHDYGLLLVDEQGLVAAWNPGAERVYGWTAAEMIGAPLLRIYPPEAASRETLVAELDALRRSGRTETEEWRIRKDGARIWNRIVNTAVRDQGGTIRGFAGVYQDLTARRELEKKLLRAQRFDAIGKLAGGIAHDFNNMLMIVLSRCDDLLRLAPASETERRYIENIKQAALRSADLTRQLLATARREILRPEVVDLSELVASTMRLLERSIGEDIHIVTELVSPSWTIHADPSKLHQVILNLALNARDAMPGGGALTVETRNLHVGSDYVKLHPALSEGDYALLLVSDTGCGIASEDRERIWEPFFSTKTMGTGLGLSVVRGIVEQMGGQIWMYSEPGQGTSFKIFFPRHVARAEVREERGEELHYPGGSETILLVEDEELLREMVRDALEESGYRVLEAPHPQAAMALSASFEGEIDLLVTDVVMPGRNGPELAKALRASRPGLAVIFMSGYPGNAITNAHTLEPGMRFIEKPAPSSRLLREVRESLDERAS